MMDRANSHFVECGNLTTELSHRTEGYGTLLSTTYTEYFLGQHWAAGSDRDIVLKVKTDNTIDTTWGDSGAWHYLGVNGSTSSCRDMVQLDDGRLLVAHNAFWVEGSGIWDGGKSVCCTMLDTDGAIDTTWGDNGFLVTYSSEISYGAIYPQKLLQDSSGNFHLIGEVYLVFDADGTILRQVSNFFTTGGFDMVLDADGDAVIAVGYNTQIVGATWFNVAAYNISDGTLDTTFTGNIASAGRAVIGAAGFDSVDAYAIRRVTDGYIIAMQLSVSQEYALGKLSLTGSVDTDWGVSGYNDGGQYSYQGWGMTQEDDTIYILTRKAADDQDSVAMLKYDSTGTLTDSNYILDVGVNDSYSFVTLLNENLYFGTQGSAQYYEYGIERWTTTFEYQDGFATGASYITALFPDETTAINVYEETESKLERWVITTDANLIGETVSILADGVVLADQVVDDNGHITFYSKYDEVHWGLKYESKLRPMKPVSQPDMMSATVTCKEMGISVHNTDEIEYGVHDDDMHEINFDDVQWKNKCEIDGLFTGSVCVSVPDSFSVNLPLQITTDAPLPCTVRAMIPKVD